MQISSRIEIANLPHLKPHSEHNGLIGSHLLITLNSRSNLSDLALQKTRNWYYSNPKSFVNLLLPPQGIGEGWGGVKNLRLLQELLYPCQLIALDNKRFFIIPDTFKYSKTITWFLLTILVDNLCRKYWQLSAIWLCSFATRMRVFWRQFESFCWRTNCRCRFLSRRYNFE